MPDTNFTNDVREGDIEALLERLKRCDGVNYDCSVITWEHCQLLVRVIEGYCSFAGFMLDEKGKRLLEVGPGKSEQQPPPPCPPV
jgi:hypothetical protein